MQASSNLGLGKSNTNYEWKDEGANAIKLTAEKMRLKGFVPFEKRSEYLYSTTSTENKVENHIGQYRVKFIYSKCGLTSVIAQQIKDNEEYWTFRKWNALKKNVPFSESTDAEADSKLGIFF